jgi:hypothetical protein
MLLLVCDLIKSLVASIDRALKRFFPCMGPQMVKEPLGLLKEFSALDMVTRVHSSLSLCI